MNCFVCAKPQAQRLCGACKFAVYCGETCADRDWVHHYGKVHAPSENMLVGQRFPDDNDLDQVLPGVWIGGVAALSHLDEYGIGAVITCLSPDQDQIAEPLLAQYVGKRPHLRYAWHDSLDQTLPFEDLCQAAHFIEKYRNRKFGKGILVHCAAGHSRSVSVVLFYMMHFPQDDKWKKVKLALRHIQLARPNANPNKHFWKQLKKYATRPC